MKLFLRFFLGSALALLAIAGVHAAPSIIPSGVSATAATAAPGDTITISIAATNAGAATTADDMGAGGTVTGSVTFTHRVTGHTITTGSTTFTTTAIVPGAGGSGTFSRTFTVPTITSQAGAYDASVTLTAASGGGTASGSFTSTSVLTVTGKPDLDITGLTYPSGTAYRGGDVIPMTLSYTNRTNSNGSNNVPYVSSTNGNASSFRIEVILSSNPTFGDADDFLLTFFDIGASSGSPLLANNVSTTINWNQILPGNFAGSYYVMAKIDTGSGIDETVESDLSDNGNNIYYTPDTNAARISLLPTNFPTTYWASTSGNGYSDNPSVTSDGRYTAFASDSTTLGTGDTNGVRDIFLYDNQTAAVRRLSVSQQGSQSNGASNNPAISGNGLYVAFSSDATNLALDDTNGFSDIYVVHTQTGIVTRVSLSTAGVAANGSNFKPAISTTGRFVVWESNATNLVAAGTTVGVTHIYIRDRDVSNSGTFDTAGNVSTTLVSQATGTATAGNGNSIQASISGGGQYVAFASDATNLVAGDTNALRDIFVRDVTNNVTTRVSVATGGTEATGGASRAPSINQNNGQANDGRYIAFGSEATNLVAGDTNAVSDIFVHDRTGSTTTRVSVSSAGVEASDPSSTSAQRLGSVNPSISSTGRYVAFASLANNLTAGDTVGQSQTNDSNSSVDVFVIDRDVSNSGTFDTGGNIATTMVSKNRFGYQTNSQADGTSASDLYPVISADGRWVAFPSDAENSGGLVHGADNRDPLDSNTFRDVFLHDRRINALPSATTPPSVSITSPVTATSYPVNSAITVVGSASAPAGTIASVQFFVNGTSLGTDTSFPYNATWTPTAVGTFALSALVTDSFGNQATSANVNITISAVSPTAPTVSISSPANGASLFANGATTISASATDSDGTIASVQFFANGVSIGTDTTFPYSIQFTPVATGNYTLTAVATDNGGNQTTTTGAGSPTVTVTNLSAPAISITSPTPVQINSATTITATTTTSGSIASVQFLANGTTLGTLTTAPFTFNWTPTAAGTYTLSAVATDNLGSQTTSGTISVVVSAGASPTISIASPAAGTIPVNTAQTLTATAADSDGTVVRVQFSVNGVAFGPALTAFPFTTSWTPTLTGSYTLQAVATDNLGNQTTSAAVSMTVTSGTAPSGVAVTVPANLTINTTGTVSAVATPTAPATIASIQFFANGAPIGTDTTFPYTATFTPTATGTYAITALATDTLGNRTTSASSNITVGSNILPTVSISTPADLSSVAAGATTTVTASAADTDGSIASVQFFANGASIGTASSSPYSISWKPTINGTVLLTATATDNVGGTTTSATNSITVTAANLPTVTLTSPATGATVPVNSSQTLTATATAAVGTIANVEFFVSDGVITASVGVDTTFPYSATWNTTAATSPANYTITAVATDTSGNKRTSTASTVTVSAGAAGAPSVALVSPTSGTTVAAGNALVLAANASDLDGAVSLVEFTVTGPGGTVLVGSKATSPYYTVWTPTTAGAYSITATVTDNENNRTTTAASTLTVAAQTGSAPVASLSFNDPATDTPTAGSPAVDPLVPVDVSIGSNLILTGIGADADGSIASVQFFVNGTSIATDATSPFYTTHTLATLGSVVLTALVTDNAGNSVYTAPRFINSRVSVSASASSVTLVSPIAASTYVVGESIVFQATHNFGSDAPPKIDFYLNGNQATTVSAEPYQFIRFLTRAGTYDVHAVVRSGTITKVSAVRQITVTSNTAPTVSITAPAAGSTASIGTPITVSANATDTDGTIQQVQFFANGVSIGTDTTLPYSVSFSPAAAGVYNLTAIATDSGGEQTVSAVRSVTFTGGTAPTISITSPLTGGSVAIGASRTIDATATATSPATIANVQFLINGLVLSTDTTFPYSATWAPTAPGTYSLTAIATDSVGIQATSSAQTITVAANVAPTINVTAPTAAFSVGVGSVNSVTANATDNDGNIVSVQFFVDGVSIGTDTTSPYTASWTPTIAATSTSITAVATDDLGLTTTSTAITGAVTAGLAPTVAIALPSGITAAAVNSAVTLTATATPTVVGNTITGVQFFANNVLIGTATTFPYTVTWSPTALGTYSVRALATDSAGNRASASMSVVVGTNTAPSVAIGSPANAATVPVGTATTITATATDTDGTIAGVQFFVNGGLIATDTTSPYTASWTPTIDGSYTLTAVATDNSGATTTSSTISVTAGGGNAPTVSITAPLASAIAVGSSNTVTALANATVTGASIAQVQFFANNTSIGTALTFPHTITWTPTVNGTYALTAVATDTAGNRATSSSVTVTVAANQAPTVAITAPANGATPGVGSPVSVTATASDTDGTIASVQFFVTPSGGTATSIGTDTTSPYAASWTPTTAGSYTLTAVATDNVGRTTTSSAITVNVSGGLAPTVVLASPGATIANGTVVPLTATASAATGTIASVQFFVNGTSLATDTTFPYATTWTPIANGNYSLTAVAVDTAGNSTTSATVNVTVAANVAPTVSVTAPANGATVGVGSVNTVTGTASDTDGSVVSVQFFANGVSLGAADTTSPYTASWTPTVAGTYTLTAVATDNLGATTTSTANTITVTGGNAPTVTVASPTATVAVNSTVALTATATAVAPATIASVQFFANGTSLGAADTTFPYSANWTPVATGTYSITAVAIDSSGNQSTSSAVAVTVGANQLPTVSVTAPANGASVGVGSSNTITATAADADGSVASVQFFANGVSLGTDTTAPYSVSWTPTIAGTYAITALATDNTGATTTSSTNTVTVTGGNAPTVSVTAPAGGSAVAVNSVQTVTATANATLAGATIASVQFFANGVSLGTDTTFPYSTTWAPSALGTYAITALATDTSGNQATSTANSVTVSTAGSGPAPTITLTSPNAGATYVVGQPVTMGATVGLGSSFITSVQFFVNGIAVGGGSTPPNGQGTVPFWTAAWTPAAPGTYSVTGVVTDASGVQVTSSAVSITVSAVTPPTIAIASPSNATSFAPNIPQTLVANVANVTGTSVLNVQFFANNVALGTVTSFPYTVSWTPTTTGSYSVIAVVNTSAGTAVTSAPVVYSVASGTLPTISVTAPASVSVGFPSTLVATAAATQAGAVMRDVQFFVNGISIGTDSTFPFSLAWTPIVPGSYSVIAVATDTFGNRNTSAAVAVTANAVSPGAPTVNIVTPANPSTVSIGTSPAPVVTITANATDSDGTIVSVQFFANGISLGTVNAFPYTTSWTPVAEGTYNLTAIATDNGGNQSTSTPVVVTATAAGAPTVTISTSAAGNTSTVNSPVTLNATATASFGRTVASVQFFANGIAVGAADTVFPYTVTWTPTAPGTYAITATATDDIAVSGTSAATNITITAGTPPTVNITSPGSGGSVAVSTAQTFTATASATAPALVASVQFLINGTSIGTDTTSPYSVTYTPPSLGSYTLTAVATDTLGNTTTSSAVNFTVVAAVGPTVVVTSPTNGTNGPVGNAVTVTANPTSGGTITSVQFFANGVSIGTDTTAPYSVVWTPLTGGPVSITAVATDNNNVTGAISAPVNFTVTTPPATVSITGPAAGTTLPVNIPQTIFASANVNTGTVTAVQFFVNGVSIGTDNTFPYSIPWTPVTAGTFALTAKATDNFGTVTDSATTTGVVTVTVTGGTAPSVSISSPSAGTTVPVGLAQTIVANATAVNGTVANVQFFANNVSLGTDTTFPYNQTWTPTAVGTYDLKAVATDTLGNQTSSILTTVTVAAVSAGSPVVSLTAPAAGASLPVGVSTLLTSTATDPDGTIASVEFIVNGVVLGTDTTFPYNLPFTPGATGTYVIAARATDNGGNITTSAPVTVTVSGGTAPSIAIDSPANAVTLGVNVPQTILATATSQTGFIKDVQFFLNGQPLSTDASFPYAADWNPTAVGTYTLTARATDNLGNITDSAPVLVTIGASAAPTISLTNPANGSSYVVGASLNLTADAADSDGFVTGVQFFVNGVPQGTLDAISPYTGTWAPGATGVYTLTARATDNNGNVTTSAPVTVTIGANAAPTVALTSPAAGSYSLGNVVLVSASANDSDGSVASVQFFANGLSVGTATTAPFNTSWRPTLAGTYRLTAVATDNVGNVTTSTAVNVTITATAAPAVTITNPIVGQPYGVGNVIPFTANPIGGNGPISQVQFFVNGTSVGVDTTAPYTSTFTPNAPGTYSLLAIATDSAGLSSSSSAAISIAVTGNSAPVVTITSPPSGTSVNGGTLVNLTAIATDVDGNVVSVRFLANGNEVGTVSTTVPFGTTWVPSAAGSYRVTAQATDNSGNVTNSAPITVSVAANAVPTVTLTAPTNGSTVRVGSGATLTATAGDPDGTIASVQFFANGLSISTDTTSPYAAQWTPGAEGIYRLTAVALDNSGAATTSATTLVLAVSAAAGGTDAVYSGGFSGSGEIGRFAAINMRGKSAAFIGYTTTSPTKIYFFDSLTVDLGGSIFVPDSLGRAVISGSLNDTGASGQLDAGRVTFIGPIAFPSTVVTVASGLYTGNLTGRAGSLLTAIVGPDGSIFAYVTDGANFRDAGSGSVNSAGNFTIVTVAGNRLVGRADPATGFLTGTLTGGPGGAFTAAIASGVSFSDGFLRNLSTRAPVGAGGDVMIAGFAVSGSTPKRVLVRAIGPSLAAFGITGALADTRLDLFSGNTLVVANDNWGGAGDVIAASTAVGAFPLSPTSLDSVVLATLPPGLYTAQVSGVGGRTGVALVELYDLDTLQAFSTQKLTNVATKATLTAAQNQIIAGFQVSGSTAKKVLIRAVGPTLATAPFNVPGTLADPMLRLVRGDNTVIRENDNWERGNDAALINEASAKVGAFALATGAKDSAILINLPPGTYSAQVSGAAPGTGSVLIEVYEVP